jgi:hypothetical protein
MFVRNVGIYLQVLTALQPRRPTSVVRVVISQIPNMAVQCLALALCILDMLCFVPGPGARCFLVFLSPSKQMLG